MKNVLLFITLSMSLSLHAAGLSGGDQFSAQLIEGRIQVQCSDSRGGPTYGHAICQSDILNPGEYSFFIGPKIDADQVTLKAVREDGSISKTKTEKYDGKKGKSKKAFNLWISTLLQRPLLGFGKNTVSYRLIKDGEEIQSGTFMVNVVDGGRAICQRIGHYYSNNSVDCNSPQVFCSRYFGENNYCQ